MNQHSSNKPIPNSANQELELLKKERDLAWTKFNPLAPHDPVHNDWVTFALTNAKWVQAYQKTYGNLPPNDEIDEIISLWRQWQHADKAEIAKTFEKTIREKLGKLAAA